MEGACHKRVVVRGIAEYHQLGTAQGIMVPGGFGCLSHDSSHQFHRVHVNACLGGAHIDGTAYALCLGQRLGNGENQVLVSPGHALAHKGGIAADEVYAHFLCSQVKGLGYGDEILRALAGRTTHQRNGGDGDTLVDNGNTEISLDILARGNQVLCQSRDFLINLFIESLKIAVHTVQEADAQGNGTHIQLLMFNHVVGLIYLVHIYVNHSSFVPFF